MQYGDNFSLKIRKTRCDVFIPELKIFQIVLLKKAVDFLIRKDFPRDILVSHILGLEESFRAFDLMTSRKAMRVVLRP